MKVGGETLDAALATLNTFGRIIACGCVSRTSPSSARALRLR